MSTWFLYTVYASIGFACLLVVCSTFGIFIEIHDWWRDRKRTRKQFEREYTLPSGRKYTLIDTAEGHAKHEASQGWAARTVGWLEGWRAQLDEIHRLPTTEPKRTLQP